MFVGRKQIDHIEATPTGSAPYWNHPDIWIQEEQEWTALTSSVQGFDKEIKFEITPDFDKLGPIRLEYQRSAVSQDATDKFRFHDWEPIAFIKKIEFKTNNKVFYTLYKHELFFNLVMRTPKGERNRLAEIYNGYTSEPERLTIANTATTYQVKLCVPWQKLTKHIPQRALPNKVEVSVFTEKFVDCGYTTTNSGSYTNSSATISNMKLVGEGLHKRNEEKVKLQEIGLSGLDWKVWDWEFQEDASIAATSTTKTIDLDQIKNDSFMQYFTIRPATKVPSGAQSNVTNPWHFVKCSQYYIKDGTKNLFDTITTDEQEQLKMHEMFPFAPYPSPFHIINYCPRQFVEASDYDCYGSRAMVHYNKPQLVIDFAAATPEAYRVDFYSKYHNVMRMQGGGARVILSS